MRDVREVSEKRDTCFDMFVNFLGGAEDVVDQDMMHAVRFHCDCCGKNVLGSSWHCNQCDDYDVCEDCYAKGHKHEAGHTFTYTDMSAETKTVKEQQMLQKEQLQQQKEVPKLEDMMQKMFESEQLKGDSKYACASCRGQREAVKWTRITPSSENTRRRRQ